MLAFRYALLFISVYVLWFISIVLIDLAFDFDFGGMAGHITGVVLSSVLVLYRFETKHKRIFLLSEMILLLIYTNVLLIICNVIDLLFINQRSVKDPVAVLVILSLIQISLTSFNFGVYRGKILSKRIGKKGSS